MNRALTTWQCLYTNSYLEFCAELYVSHTKTMAVKMKSCTKVMFYISLVVYIYYKCTIWLQYKRFLQINPFGNINMTNTTNQRHNRETIQSRAKTRQASSKPFDLVSPFTDLWSSCNKMHHQGNIYIFFWNIHLMRQEPLIALRANASKQGEGWKQMSATQEHESQHWENQCSTLFFIYLNVVPYGGKTSPRFPLRIKNPFLH